MTNYHWHVYETDRHGELNLCGNMKTTKEKIKEFKKNKKWFLCHEVSKYNEWKYNPKHVKFYEIGKEICPFCDIDDNDIIEEFKCMNESLSDD